MLGLLSFCRELLPSSTWIWILKDAVPCLTVSFASIKAGMERIRKRGDAKRTEKQKGLIGETEEIKTEKMRMQGESVWSSQLNQQCTLAECRYAYAHILSIHLYVSVLPSLPPSDITCLFHPSFHLYTPASLFGINTPPPSCLHTKKNHQDMITCSLSVGKFAKKFFTLRPWL